VPDWCCFFCRRFGDTLHLPNAKVVEGFQLKYHPLVGDLAARGRRRWAATEAMALGRGIVAVDIRNKEVLGNMANGGQEYRPRESRSK
jgi:hypothetical protein